MPRVKEKKTDRKRISDDVIKEAIKSILNDNIPIRVAAEKYDIKKSTLFRHLAAAKKNIDEGRTTVLNPRCVPNQVFSFEQEKSLVDYLITASKMHHGLTTVESRKLAYQYAKILELPMPNNWKEKFQSGPDWLYGFMKRNPSLSIRAPESTSLSRATSFNRTNVEYFYEKLAEVYQRFKFEPHRTFNCDETGCTTVHKPPNVITKKGLKQVGQITSAERGKLVTVCCFISASGATIPPAFVFPRATVPDFLLDGAPSGSLGLAYKTGWMNGDNFYKVMIHFAKYTNASPENPVLLLMDNHESHVTVATIQYAKDNGIILLTFPPHCSHRLQPLDVSVYGPFKKRFNIAFNDWLLSNPEKAATYHQIPSLVDKAFVEAFNPKNILSGFSASGIYPLNQNIFDEDDFMSSFVTDRSDPDSKVTEPSTPLQVPEPSTSLQVTEPSTSFHKIEPPTSMQKTQVLTSMLTPVTPETVRPYPKAPARKTTTSGRKRGKCRILTDTPEKMEIERAFETRLVKASKKQARKALKNRV